MTRRNQPKQNSATTRPQTPVTVAPHSAPPDTEAKTAGTSADDVPVTPPDDGIYWETKVADALGLARDRVRAIRQEHFEEGKHFRLVRGEVVLTEQGLTRLNEVVAADGAATPAEADTPAAKFPVPKGPPRRARFAVSKIPANRRLLWGTPVDKTAGPSQVLIHVKDNSQFMPRMELEAIEAEAGSWQFRGRLPRKKGKW